MSKDKEGGQIRPPKKSSFESAQLGSSFSGFIFLGKHDRQANALVLPVGSPKNFAWGDCACGLKGSNKRDPPKMFFFGVICEKQPADGNLREGFLGESE